MGCFGSKHIRDDAAPFCSSAVAVNIPVAYSGTVLTSVAAHRQLPNTSLTLVHGGIPPPSHSSHPRVLRKVRNITNLVSKTKDEPTIYNGSSDIYEGTLRPKREKIAIKVLRFPDTQGVALDRKGLAAIIQRRLLRNPHRWIVPPHSWIVPCLGYAIIDSMPCIITPWYTNGSVDIYLQGNTLCDRLSLVSQIADGLDYLHRKGVVHGNLKPSKILVNDQGQAMLTEFGLAKLLEETRTGPTTVDSLMLAIRYSSPEKLQGQEVDTKADVYSFGCVAFEILTGNAPFHALTSPSAVAAAKAKGISPSHSPLQKLVGNVRIGDLLNQCWRQDAAQRPDMTEVVQEIRKIGLKA